VAADAAGALKAPTTATAAIAGKSLMGRSALNMNLSSKVGESNARQAPS
jgi:hypothetical protein